MGQRWFFAGALANGALWRDVIARLESRYRCISVDLPLGAHSHPLSIGADRSAPSWPGSCSIALTFWAWTTPRWSPTIRLADCSSCPSPAVIRGSGRITCLVLTNCDSYDQFPPERRPEEGSRLVSPAAPAVRRA